MLYPIQNNVRNKLDLSGIWDFKTDPDGVGEKNGWFNGLAEARSIAVPGSWNEQYEDLFGYLGLAWYVQQAYIPSSWQGQRVFIRVGSANYHGTVYVNGEKVGEHDGGHLPFAFEITSSVSASSAACWLNAMLSCASSSILPSIITPLSSITMTIRACWLGRECAAAAVACGTPSGVARPRRWSIERWINACASALKPAAAFE